MKLPWDKKYLKISFHVVVTVLALYVVGLLLWNITAAKDLFVMAFQKMLSVFAPLLVACVFAFLTNPAVELFQKLWENFLPIPVERGRCRTRKRGTATFYIVLFLAIGLFIKYLASQIGSTDINALAEQINKHIQGFADMLVLLNVKLTEYGALQSLEGVLQSLEGLISGWTSGLSDLLQGTVMSIANSITKAGGWAINLVLGLTIGFYLLVDKDRVIKQLKKVVDVFFSPRYARWIKGWSHETNSVFTGYIGGQVTDAIIMAVMVSISFSIIGIPYPVLIGVISGFSNLIPYVGAVMAFLLSVAMGLLSGAPIKALYAVIVVLVLQQIDSIFIVPKVVGKSVELHPALVLLSLSIFGGLFGLLGMVVAVPLGALLKIACVRLYERKCQAREDLEVEETADSN